MGPPHELSGGALIVRNSTSCTLVNPAMLEGAPFCAIVEVRNTGHSGIGICVLWKRKNIHSNQGICKSGDRFFKLYGDPPQNGGATGFSNVLGETLSVDDGLSKSKSSA